MFDIKSEIQPGFSELHSSIFLSMECCSYSKVLVVCVGYFGNIVRRAVVGSKYSLEQTRWM